MEEWDESFVQLVLQASEVAILSRTNPSQPPDHHHHHRHHHHHQQPPLPPRQQSDISYSPPRELSQRVNDTPAVLRSGYGEGYSYVLPCLPSNSASASVGPETTKEPKIVGFKDKKEEQLKFTSSKSNDKETENSKSNSLRYDGVVADDFGFIPECQKSRSSDEMPSISLNRSSSRAVGVQTDDLGEFDNPKSRNDNSFLASDQQKKLLGIWDLLDGEKSEKSLALKLFEACGTDFQVLSGYIYPGLPSITTMQSSLPKSDGPFWESPLTAHSAEQVKISRLFVMLTKISNEMVRLEDLLDALIDCCSLKNDVIVHVSLRMLHVVLKHASWMRKELTRRDNFVFTGPSSDHILEDIHNQELFERRNVIYPSAKSVTDKLDSQGASWRKPKSSTIFNPTKVDWFSLFESMNQIVMSDFDERVRLEAILIMNTILVSCNAYSERDKFASKLVFQTVSLLLRKEAGVCLRKQAVNLFNQLLNCPKVTTAFCCGCMEDDDGVVKAEVDAKILLSAQEFRGVFNGLVDCLSCTGSCPKKLKLRRSTVTVIAYIASLGKPGIGILLNHRPPQRYNMLVSIVESLISDLDLETLEAVQPFEVFRERTLLIREALILLNRLVSHPQFSSNVLQALTNSRDITSLTVDIAKRLCQKRKFSWLDDSITKQIRESEIAELARLFNRRIFTFLGDNLS